MSCLSRQLTSDSVTLIVQKLEEEKSASVKQYNPLLSQVRRISDEAASNIKNLSLLETSNRGFEIPNGIEDYATRTLSLIRFVGVESPFYHGDDKMDKLCSAFGAEVIRHLQRYVNFEVIFDGDPDEGRKAILACTECCEIIKCVYERFVDMDQSSDTPIFSRTSGTRISNRLDTFVQRCNDLIRIADSRMIFHKSERFIVICGPRAIKLRTLYCDIEDSFHASQREIKKSRDDILDVASSAWLYRISKFNDGIRSVENMVKNWINVVFEDITNVEEGILALHGIKTLARRNNLRDTLNEKWIQIWQIFDEELESCSTSTQTTPNKLTHHLSLPPYSGNANIIRSNKMYLARQYKMLMDASDWFGDCEAQKAITKKYRKVSTSMIEKEETLFLEWQKYIIDKKINPEFLLNEPILKYRGNDKFQIVEVNMEKRYLESIREASHWDLLGYETKNIFSKNCPKWDTLKLRYNQVERMCIVYNTIRESKPDTEITLFPTLWDELEDTTSLAFEKATWSSDSFTKYFAKYTEAITKVQNSFETYGRIQNAIEEAMKQIGNTNLVNPKGKSIDNRLEDFRILLERNRLYGTMQVDEKCESILKLLSDLKKTIYLYESQATDSWSAYLENTYDELKANFINCLCASLTSILKMFRDDSITESPELPEMNVQRTSIKSAKSEISLINASAFKDKFPAEKFENIFETNDPQVFLDCVDRDQEIMNLRTLIDEYFNCGS